MEKKTDQNSYSDLRLFLQTELVKRCEENPKYSLRTFAKSLNVDPSVLSKILSGKRSITYKMYIKLAQSLGLSFEQFEKLNPYSEDMRDGCDDVVEYKQLALDNFKIISDWYHFAILELTRVKGFRPDVKWVARILDISFIQVRSAIERLQRLGFLSIEDGKWIDTSDYVTIVTDEITTVAQRKFQKQVLQKAMDAMDQVPMSLRDQSTMTMAIDSSKLGEAKNYIKEFRRNMNKLLQNDNEDSVYNLTVSLYPLTKMGDEQ